MKKVLKLIFLLSIIVIIILTSTFSVSSFFVADDVILALTATLFVASGVNFVNNWSAMIAAKEFQQSFGDGWNNLVRNGTWLVNSVGQAIYEVDMEKIDAMKNFINDNYVPGTNSPIILNNYFEVNGMPYEYIPTGVPVNYEDLGTSWFLPSGHFYSLEAEYAGVFTAERNSYRLYICQDYVRIPGVYLTTCTSDLTFIPSAKFAFVQMNPTFVGLYVYIQNEAGVYQNNIMVTKYKSVGLSSYTFPLVVSPDYTVIADESITDMSRDWNTTEGDRAVIVPPISVDWANVNAEDVQTSLARENAIINGVATPFETMINENLLNLKIDILTGQDYMSDVISPGQQVIKDGIDDLILRGIDLQNYQSDVLLPKLNIFGEEILALTGTVNALNTSIYGNTSSIDSVNTKVDTMTETLTRVEEMTITSTDAMTGIFEPGILNFEGLKNLVVFSKFPFCIPFDMIRTVNLFAVSASEPSFVIDLNTTYFHVYHEIDITPLAFYIAFFRYFVVFCFVYFLIVKTSTLIKW